MRSIYLACLAAILLTGCRQNGRRTDIRKTEMPATPHGGKLISIDTPGISARYRVTIRIDGKDCRFSSLTFFSQEEIALLKDSLVNCHFDFHTRFHPVKKKNDSIITAMSLIYDRDAIEGITK